jgi:transposase-like protein
MLAAALEDEVAAYIAAHPAERDGDGRRLVVRNGHARPREVTTVAGALEVRAPRVDDRRVDEAAGERARFRSSILPPWRRKSPKITEVLPLLYLHCLSIEDFVPALEQFLGSGAGLSASAITRLTETWQEEHRRWCGRDLSGADYVYCWADGRTSGCGWMLTGCAPWWSSGCAPTGRRIWSPSPTGTASLPSRGPGCCGTPGGGACRPRCWRSATGRWGSPPRWPRYSPRPDRAAAGCTRWSTPSTACPNRRSLRPARRWRRSASKPGRQSSTPKAVAKITGDQEQLLAFFDFPAEHWIHLKTSNPTVISIFSTVRLPTRVTQGPGSPAAGLAMVFKLIEAASERWRYVNGPHLAALVRAGVRFEKGVLVEWPDEAEIKVDA